MRKDGEPYDQRQALKGPLGVLAAVGLGTLAALNSTSQASAGGGCYDTQNQRVDCNDRQPVDVNNPVITSQHSGPDNTLVILVAAGAAAITSAAVTAFVLKSR